MRRTSILVAALALACGGKRGPSDAGADAGYSGATVCQQLAQAQCDFLARCYPEFNRLSASDCLALQESVCADQLAPVVDSVNAGRVQPDNTLVQSCVTRMEQAPCPAALPPTAPAIALRAFEDCQPAKVYLGTVAEGAVCKSPADCVPGDYCNQPPGTCAGVCVAYSKPGDLCSGGCDPTLGYCDTTQTPSTCAAFKAANTSCVQSSECSPELSCRGGVCLPAPQQGQACVFFYDRLPYCAPGLACDVAPYVTASGTCVVPGGTGAACHYHWSCAPPLVCRGLDWSQFPQAPPPPGTCGPPANEGESCHPSQYAIYVGDECAAGLACDAATSTCKKPPASGEACDPTLQNCVGPNVWCSNPLGASPTCGPPPTIGQQCAWLPNGQVVQVPCANGWCDTSTTQCAAASAQTGSPCTQDAQCISGRCETNQDLSRTCWAKCTN